MNNRKKEDDGGKIKEEIPKKIIEEAHHKFGNLIHENNESLNLHKEKKKLNYF